PSLPGHRDVPCLANGSDGEIGCPGGAGNGSIDPLAGHTGAEPAGDLGRDYRPAEIEALHVVTPVGGEPFERGAVLDAFGDDADAEAVGQLDDRTDDRRVVLVVEHVDDERLVDLDLVHGEALEVPERRVAGAEVVDGETH